MDSPKPNTKNSLRLQKFLADCGIGSRRACEHIIAEGRVCVDGQPVTAQGHKINPDRQTVMLDGVPVSRAEKSVYICLNKPRDVICTSRDPRGRRTVQDLLPELDVRIYNVGRLDRDSEGLLLLTNDGALTQRMTHPRYHLPKIYRIWTREPLTADACRQLEAGIQHRGQCLRAARAGLLKTDRPCCEIELREGRNRQIRRMFEALGHDIQRLRRIRIGPLELGALRCGQWRYLRKDEIRRLRTATGLA